MRDERIILQDTVLDLPWRGPGSDRLPGLQPLAPGDWIQIDDAYAGQMALKAHLIAERRSKVIAVQDEARSATDELLAHVLADLASREGFDVGTSDVERPDKNRIQIRRDDPLWTVGHLVQEDFCLLLPTDKGHCLAGAVLCFPASWTLGEKLGRTLAPIHAPVEIYDEVMANRVQRIFDAVRPEMPLWRVNALLYKEPDLYQPRRERDMRIRFSGPGGYLRSEFQTVRKLPSTGAVAFGIHTSVVPMERISEADRLALRARRET